MSSVALPENPYWETKVTGKLTLEPGSSDSLAGDPVNKKFGAQGRATIAVGDVSGDLASHRGQVTGTRAAVPGQLVVQGVAPLAELAAFQTRLNALTSGQARYTLAFSHYDPVPTSTQAQLASSYKLKEDEE